MISLRIRGRSRGSCESELLGIGPGSLADDCRLLYYTMLYYLIINRIRHHPHRFKPPLASQPLFSSDPGVSFPFPFAFPAWSTSYENLRC